VRSGSNVRPRGSGRQAESLEGDKAVRRRVSKQSDGRGLTRAKGCLQGMAGP